MYMFLSYIFYINFPASYLPEWRSSTKNRILVGRWMGSCLLYDFLGLLFPVLGSCSSLQILPVQLSPEHTGVRGSRFRHDL